MEIGKAMLVWPLRHILQVFAALALALPTYACGDPGCDGEDVDLTDSSPRVLAMDLRTDPVSGDPWEMVFVVDFTDADGDLANGKAQFFVGSSSQATELDLFDLFRQSGLAPESTRGKVGVALRFGDNVPDGRTVRLSLQLIDQSKNRSNCYSLDLKFDVKPVSGASALRKRWALARALLEAFGDPT